VELLPFVMAERSRQHINIAEAGPDENEIWLMVFSFGL